MPYTFLIETYATERKKVLSVWSMFEDGDLRVLPNSDDIRGRSVREQLVHQCVSEDLWFRTMLEIDVQASPLPRAETRIAFIERYAEDSGRRLAQLREKDGAWWEADVGFSDVERIRAWVFTRRLLHTAHHWGQQTAYLRMLGRSLHSTYGPTADTGGLAQDQASTIYPYTDIDALI